MKYIHNDLFHIRSLFQSTQRRPQTEHPQITIMSTLDFDQERAQWWIADVVDEMEQLSADSGDDFDKFTFKEIRGMFASRFLGRVRLQIDGVPIVLKTNSRGPIHDHYMHPDEKKWLKQTVRQVYQDRELLKKDKKPTISFSPGEDKIKVDEVPPTSSTPKSAATKAKTKGKAKGGFAAQFDKTLFSIITSMGIRKREGAEWSRKKLMQEMHGRLTDMKDRGWRPKPREKKEGEGESKSKQSE